jgi:peptidoglycan/LPS O-acetylase OafA/YrhL
MNAGLNLLRFFLAVNVVAFHLWNAAAPGAGPVAVLGFFFVSGFLVTQIVQEVYRGPGGAGAFVLNRTLRIYPSYLAALGLGLLALRLFPQVAQHIHSDLRWPASAAEWWPQFNILGLGDSAVRVLPAAWTLGTELVFYAVIGLGTGRSRRATAWLCVASLPLGAACAWQLLPVAFYGSVLGNGFVFALGSFTYFQRAKLRVGPGLFVLACAAWAVALYGVPALEQSDLDNANLAGSVLPFAVILLFVVQHELRAPRWVRLAAVLGRAAYPLFLLHWAVSVVVSAALFDGRASFDLPGAGAGAGYFAVVLCASLACALLFVQVVDRPIERLRRRVRWRMHSRTG